MALNWLSMCEKKALTCCFDPAKDINLSWKQITYAFQTPTTPLRRVASQSNAILGAIHASIMRADPVRFSIQRMVQPKFTLTERPPEKRRA